MASNTTVTSSNRRPYCERRMVERHRAVPFSWGEDVLPWLSCLSAELPVFIAEWIRRAMDVGAALTFGVPGSPTAAQNWLGNRLVYWPQGVPRQRRVGIVSSRLGRELDSQDAWFQRLRLACEHVDTRSELITTASQTTAAKFVQRAAAHFGLPVLRIETPSDHELQFDCWFEQLATTVDQDRDCQFRMVLSPPLSLDSNSSPPPAIAELPLRDRALVSLSDKVLAFQVRRGGRLHTLLRSRLESDNWPVGSVYLAIDSSRNSRSMGDELMAIGAVGWICLAEDSLHVRLPAVSESLSVPTTATLIAKSAQSWPYLTHCTRRRVGPWPGQTQNEFLDELVLQQAERARSPLDSLRRIIDEQRLLASADGIRGGQAVVSFTAAPLAEIPKLRVFRSHRGRWDFEPYGICIRREWLRAAGARPVIYGDDSTWTGLSESDRPYFQCRQASRDDGATAFDWTVEREWRHLGDVDLAAIPDDAAVVFVQSADEAESLRPVCRWPVIVL